MAIEDHSGHVKKNRVRDIAALEFSGLESCNQFCEEVRIGGLNFPVLASIRVLVRKQTPATEEADKQAGKESDSASEHNISAIIMEATEQLVGEPKALPNASMHYLGELMKIVGATMSDRMLVAPATAMRYSPHGGLIVEDDDGARRPGACVLTLLANVGKCDVKNFEGGHRIETMNAWNVPFLTNTNQDAGPQHTDVKLSARFVSYCTMNNVQFFTLSSRKPKEAVYAVVVITSVHTVDKMNTFMMNKVHVIPETDVLDWSNALKMLSVLSKRSSLDAGPRRASTPLWSEEMSPFHAKKARRLYYQPTDVEMK